mmetsp:Transcript_10583/g.65106  ORF Transcript_10583/g.65106 Transcript_10583/m.65106 type:complete len:314 (+) Transcript_10583:102-1043(+)
MVAKHNPRTRWNGCWNVARTEGRRLAPNHDVRGRVERVETRTCTSDRRGTRVEGRQRRLNPFHSCVVASLSGERNRQIDPRNACPLPTVPTSRNCAAVRHVAKHWLPALPDDVVRPSSSCPSSAREQHLWPRKQTHDVDDAWPTSRDPRRSRDHARNLLRIEGCTSSSPSPKRQKRREDGRARRVSNATNSTAEMPRPSASHPRKDARRRFPARTRMHGCPPGAPVQPNRRPTACRRIAGCPVHCPTAPGTRICRQGKPILVSWIKTRTQDAGWDCFPYLSPQEEVGHCARLQGEPPDLHPATCCRPRSRSRS